MKDTIDEGKKNRVTSVFPSHILCFSADLLSSEEKTDPLSLKVYENTSTEQYYLKFFPENVQKYC